MMSRNGELEVEKLNGQIHKCTSQQDARHAERDKLFTFVDGT